MLSLYTALKRRLLIFDFVHVSLFFLSIFHVIIVSIAYYLVNVTVKQWDFYEKSTERDALREKQLLLEKINSQYKFILLFRWILLFRYTNAVIKVTYFKVRQRFISINKIHNRQFSFHRYLKYCIFQIFSDLIDVNWKVWVIIWFAFISNYVRNKFFDMRTQFGGVPIFVSIFGGGTVVLAALVYLAVRIGYRFYLAAIENLNSEKEESTPLINIAIEQGKASNQEAIEEDRMENSIEEDVADMIASPVVEEESSNNNAVTAALSFDDNSTSITHSTNSLLIEKQQNHLKDAIQMQRFFFIRLPDLTLLGIQVYLLLQSVCFT